MSYLNEFIFKYIYRSNNTQMASLPSQYYIYHKYIFNDIEVCWFCSLFDHEKKEIYNKVIQKCYTKLNVLYNRYVKYHKESALPLTDQTGIEWVVNDIR